MEIIVMDDASTSSPAEIIHSVAPNRIRLIRQSENIGKVRNYETGLAVSRGRFIHQLHGDDRVLPRFYARLEDAFERFSGAGAFYSASRYIDESGAVVGETGRERSTAGIVPDFLRKIFTSQRVQTPAMVVKREVYERLGGFDRRLDAFEDWEMWVRIANSYSVGCVPDVLAEYRVSPTNNTARTTLDGTRGETLRRLIGIVDSYVPPAIVEELRHERNLEMAQYFTQLIPLLVAHRQVKAIVATSLEALRFSPAPRTWYRLAYFAANYRRFLAS